ncbi:MAG: preprotein translocase subunit SecG [Paracoccaceae bacterium]
MIKKRINKKPVAIMENVILTIHLILAVFLVGLVLLQRSEGGGLGIGGNNSGLVSGRSAASALTRFTWLIATAFIITSISLTIVSAKKSSDNSIINDSINTNSEGEIELPNIDELISEETEESIPVAD